VFVGEHEFATQGLAKATPTREGVSGPAGTPDNVPRKDWMSGNPFLGMARTRSAGLWIWKQRHEKGRRRRRRK
jgi:hypothetical protein